jgi:hypothetical protein
MRAWTDFPFTELGDVAGVEAPVRDCTVLNYDRDKHCRVLVDDVFTSVKAGYLYSQPGRSGAAPRLTQAQLLSLPSVAGLRVPQ